MNKAPKREPQLPSSLKEEKIAPKTPPVISITIIIMKTMDANMIPNKLSCCPFLFFIFI